MSAPEVERSASPVRPVARWVSTTDERGRRRLVMVWHIPDADAALHDWTSSATATATATA